LNHRPKFGFDAQVVTDERGNRKKKPVVNEHEAQTVRRMFDLASAGHGALKIAAKLRVEGRAQRSGKPWSKQAVLDCLRDPAYKGAYTVNMKDHKRGGRRPEEDWIVIPAEPIVPPEEWDQVAAFLSSRSPAVTNPAVVSSPLLLTGLLECGRCGASMCLETGKGGRYRYYNCRRRLREGTGTCEGTRSRVEHLERSLLGHLQHELFRPERVRRMLEGLNESLMGLAADRHQRRNTLQAQRRGLEDRLRRQYEAIETGVVNSEDVGERVRELKALLADADQQLAALSVPPTQTAIPVDDRTVERFTDRLEDLLLSEDRAFARRYLQLLLSRVVVDGKVIHVHAKAAGVAQVAVTQKEEAMPLVTDMASVPTTDYVWLRILPPSPTRSQESNHLRNYSQQRTASL
jgi:hypothetical protein